MAEVIASPEFALELFAQIEEKDSVIEAASGSKEAGKRKIANDTASETEDSWKKNLSQLKSAIDKVAEDPKAVAGAFTGITAGLREAYGKQVDAWLDAEVEARKSDSPSVSADQLSEAQEARKELVEQYKAVVTVLGHFGHKEEDFPTPKRMSGPRGPQGDRGPRFPKNLQLSVDGKPRSTSQNSMSSVFQTVVKGTAGFENLKSTRDFKQYLKDEFGLDPESTPPSFEFTLANGKILSGVLTNEQVAADDDDDDEDNENGTDTEE